MIANVDWTTFLTLEGEKLLLVRRKHVLVVILPILFASFCTCLFLSASFLFFLKIFFSLPLFIVTTLLIVSFTLSIIAKTIIDWYFHLYVLTNRKILEVWYTPLAAHIISDVLLDKVNCTEVDLRINGFMNELLDMGDIVITFDRPTHQEEFVLSDIQECGKIGKFLTQQLIDHQVKDQTQTIWFKRHTNAILGI